MDFPAEKPPTGSDKFSVAVTPGTSNTMGAYAQLSAAIGHAGRWVIFSAEVDGGGSAGVDVEIGQGGAGSETFIASMIVGNNSTTSSSESNCASFPFYIAEGTRLAARGAATGSSAPGNVRVRVTVLY